MPLHLYRRHRPGLLMASWAVDRAARDGRAWVRLGCLEDRLVRYYAAQGFRLVREVSRGSERMRLMARPAEPLAELQALMAGSGRAEGVSR